MPWFPSYDFGVEYVKEFIQGRNVQEFLYTVKIKLPWNKYLTISPVFKTGLYTGYKIDNRFNYFTYKSIAGYLGVEFKARKGFLYERNFFYYRTPAKEIWVENSVGINPLKPLFIEAGLYWLYSVSYKIPLVGAFIRGSLKLTRKVSFFVQAIFKSEKRQKDNFVIYQPFTFKSGISYSFSLPSL